MVNDVCGPEFHLPSGRPEPQRGLIGDDAASGESKSRSQPPRGESEPSAAKALDDMLSIQDYERKRLGQELHDATGQLLVSLQISISRLRNVAEEFGQGRLIEEIGDTLRQIDQQIRSFAFLEYPVELRDRDLGSAVKVLALGFGRRTGIRTSFKSMGEVSAVGPQTATAILRVAQEALVNVHRHSHATSAKVLLEMGGDRVQLTISDDGVGFVDIRNSAVGLGLQGMRHRVEMLGGRFRASNLKRGARISATVPMRGDDRESFGST